MVWPTLGSRTAKEQEQEPMGIAIPTAAVVQARYSKQLNDGLIEKAT